MTEIKVSRVRLADLAILSEVSVGSVMGYFQALGKVNDLSVMADKLGTSYQNVRSWATGKCNPENANFVKVLRYTLQVAQDHNKGTRTRAEAIAHIKQFKTSHIPAKKSFYQK